jgi:RimJ/RimL family protein N-acetyltransferase
VSSLALPLEGRIVRLEPLEPRHEEPLWEAAQDPSVWRYMRTRGGDSREAFHEWFEAARAELPFATVVEDVPLGSTSYMNVRPADRVLEIGNTWLSPAAWGTRANTEAKLLLMERAFAEGFLRVEFKTDAANERARAALLGVGGTFEGVFRKHMLVRGGERRDSAWYAVIDDDWPEVRRALEEKVSRARGGTAGP